MADPGQFPLPSFAGHHVIHSVQLFRKCWISTMAFTAALLAFVWSSLGWMWWLGVQGGLAAEWKSSCLSLSSGFWAAQLEGLVGFSVLLTWNLQAPLKMQREGWRGTGEGGECLSENCCWETKLLRQQSEGEGGGKQGGLFVALHRTRKLQSLAIQTRPVWTHRVVSFCKSLIRLLHTSCYIRMFKWSVLW